MLCHFSYDIFDLLSELLGLLHRMRLGIDSYDRLRIGFAQMHPTVGEIYLHAVDIGNLFAGIALLYLLEDSVYIDFRSKLYLVFGYGVSRISLLSSLTFLPLLARSDRKRATPTKASRP